MARKNKGKWNNFGDDVQDYDVIFEVDKMDFIKLTEGKDSEKYKTQHAKTVKLIKLMNIQTGGKGGLSMNISKARSIKQSRLSLQKTEDFKEEKISFFNNGKIDSSNKE